MEGRFLAGTVEQGYLLSDRSETEHLVGFELRGFDGETVAATGEEAARTPAVLEYLLPLAESLVKLEPRGRGGSGGLGVLTVAPWGAEEAGAVQLPRAMSRGYLPHDRANSEQFLAVPGAVVKVEQPMNDREGITVLGFR